MPSKPEPTPITTNETLPEGPAPNATDANGRRNGAWRESNDYYTALRSYESGYVLRERRFDAKTGILTRDWHFRPRAEYVPEPRPNVSHQFRMSQGAALNLWDGSSLVGEARSYHSNGSASYVTLYDDEGLRHGPEYAWDEAGKLRYEHVYEHGLREGVSRDRTVSGELREQTFERGAPILDPKLEAAVLKKLAKAKRDKKRWGLFTDRKTFEDLIPEIPGETLGPYLWSLVRRKAYAFAADPGAQDLLASEELYARAEDVPLLASTFSEWVPALDDLVKRVAPRVTPAQWDAAIGEQTSDVERKLGEHRARASG